MAEADHFHRHAWKLLAEQGQLADAIVEYVRTYDWVTFAELQRRFEPFMPVRGDASIRIACDNVVIWSGMSPEFVNLVLELVYSGRVFVHAASWLAYFLDGATLRLPLVRRPPTRAYKRPHWLPVCLLVPPPKNKGRERCNVNA
jgi:hypothetical protein